MAVTTTRTWPTVAVRVAVHLVGIVVGGFFGFASTFLWVRPPLWSGRVDHGVNAISSWGIVLGAIGGAAAGHIWCKRVLDHPSDKYHKIILRGGGWGSVVGLGVTAFLHAGLAMVRIAVGWIDLGWIDLGGGWVKFIAVLSACAVVAGFYTGCICGLLVWLVTAPRPGEVSPWNSGDTILYY